MAEIKHVTDANFEEIVLKSDRPVVVDFWAAWCGPCNMVAPEMEKLAEKYDGSIDVVKVDVDANPRLSQAFRIMSIPTIAFFRPGQQPMAVFGFRPSSSSSSSSSSRRMPRPRKPSPRTCPPRPDPALLLLSIGPDPVGAVRFPLSPPRGARRTRATPGHDRPRARRRRPG